MNEEATIEAQGTETQEVAGEQIGQEAVEELQQTQEAGTEATEATEGAVEQQEPAQEAAHFEAERQNRRYNELYKQNEASKKAEQLAIEEKLKFERENAALKARLEAGAEPIPPVPNSFQDEYGEIDWNAYQQAAIEHQSKLNQWQQAQFQPPVPETTPATPAPPQQEVPPEQNPRYQAWIAKEAQFAAENPDYHVAVQGIREFVSEDMTDYLVNSENGPGIAYYMAKNPQEFHRIASLDRIGQIEAMVGIKNKLNVQRRVKSNAPPPPETIDGSGAQAAAPDITKMSTAEFMRHRNNEERKRRGLPPE